MIYLATPGLVFKRLSITGKFHRTREEMIEKLAKALDGGDKWRVLWVLWTQPWKGSAFGYGSHGSHWAPTMDGVFQLT